MLLHRRLNGILHNVDVFHNMDVFCMETCYVSYCSVEDRLMHMGVTH